MSWRRLVRLVCPSSLVLAVGVAALAPAPAAMAAITPKTVTVQVVPALAGVTFTLDGMPGVTGPGGSVTLNDSDLGGAAANLVIPTQYVNPLIQVSLDRVADNPNHGEFSRLLVAELDENRPVLMNLVTPQRKNLALSEVSSVTLNDSLGRTLQFDRAQLAKPIWLAASRPAQVVNGVDARVVTYSIKSVIVRGSNAVNSGQLRFTARALKWQIPVILHSLTIDANDLLAGRPAGSSVVLTYPNGTAVKLPLGPNHQLTLTDLPRGTYKVKVNGGLIPLGSTIHLSRNQTATELVITAVDFLELLFMGLVILAVVVMAGIIGRRRRQMVARTEPDEPPVEPESADSVGPTDEESDSDALLV